MAKRIRGLVLAWRAIALILTCASLCALSSPASAAVGRTAGSFNVGNTGGASYSIPIFTPPGPRGVQPSVALVYSSNAGVGIIGRGWSLSGFSSISRCDKTIVQDGAMARVSGGASDGYCMDGNRLRLQSGTYGENGSVYFTELADFSRITATTTGSNGPNSWIVQRKDGLTYTYGGASDSRIQTSSQVLTWYVSEINDRVGNKVRFTYKSPDSTTYGITHPVKVEWTQTSAGSGTYVYAMDFLYSAGGNASASTVSGYDASWPVRDSDLLTNITVKVSGTLKRNYVLGYEPSPTTGAKRLIQVKECSDGGSTPSDCLSPTTITYQDGTAGVNTASPALSYTGTIYHANGNYDFNGDGIKDLVAVDWSSGYAQYPVRFGSTSGTYSSPVTTAAGFVHGRLLGNSRDQILASSGGYWYIYDWNGSGFSTINTGISTTEMLYANIIADMDGDGRADIVWVDGSHGSDDWVTYGDGYFPQITANVYRNTTSGGTVSFAAVVSSSLSVPERVGSTFDSNWGAPPSDYKYFAYLTYGNLVRGGDEDGDGREELNLTVGYDYGLWPWWLTFEERSASGYYEETGVLRFNSDLTVIPWTHAWWTDVDQAVADGDFNGDGCDDYLIYDSAYGSAAGLSDCNGGIGDTLPSIWYGANVGSADWDGDGKAELFQFDGSTLWARTATGGALGAAINTGIPWSSNCIFVRTDGNGDGLDDIGCNDFGYGLKVYSHNSTATTPDLVVQVKDGFDVTQGVTYKSIARGSYTKYTTATFPDRDVAGGLNVVSSVEATDGVGGTFTTTYTYAGAVVNQLGRGFLGFEKVEAVDSRNSVKRVEHFSQTFPYVGMSVEVATYQPDNTLIAKQTMTPDKHILESTANNQRYYAFASSSIADAYEVGGTRNGDWITRSTVSNTVDTSGNLTASTSVTTDKDSSSSLNDHYWTTAMTQTIYPNTTYWCLNLPSSTTVTQSSSVSGETTVVTAKGLSPDYVNCRQDAESVGSGALQVDTNYTYGDSFGNVTGMSVTGRNPNSSSMSARTASISWGTTGQFPVSETNALSQTTTRTFDSTFGSLLTETDPNSIVVADNDFDAFGRLIRADRADGTATTIQYNGCVVYVSCFNANNKMIVISSQRNSGNAVIRDDETYLDQFERPIGASGQLMDGSWDRKERQYDSLGRVFRESAPCAWSTCSPYSAYWVTNTYDLAGRVATQSRPQSQSVSTPVTTTFGYGGRTQSITDPQNKVTTKILDVKGQMRRSQDHSGYYQIFAYDAAGSLKGVTDSLSNTLFTASYSYGDKAFQTATTDMDLGSWSYSYNSLGERVGWTDAKSQSFSQDYDALSRVISRTDVAEGQVSYWVWGNDSGSYNIGKLHYTLIPDQMGEFFTYDNKGRVSERLIATDQEYFINYAYNNLGLIDTVTYPTSTSSARVKIKYGYAYGILQSVTDWTSGSAGTVYWAANTKNVRGQTTEETLGNGLITHRSFDAVTGWLNDIRSGPSGYETSVQNLSYAYDAVGNVTQRQESTLGVTENFCYDDLYRLRYAELGVSPSPVCASPTLTIEYDSGGMGNITSMTGTGSSNVGSYNYTSTESGCSYYSHSQKHAVRNAGGKIYCYDANGNMTKRDGQTISWSSFNYPTALATSTESTLFYYGPDRQYYKQEYTGPGGTETTHYVGRLLEKVQNGSTIDWRHSIVAEGQVVAIVSRKSTSTNEVYYPLEDNQGSGSVLTDDSGTNLVRQSYNAFGLPRDGADWDSAVPSGDKTTINGISRRGYTGHSMLGDMGLIHMNGRVQDAITGRFLSPDPTIPNPGFTQSYNRYAYVNNNPLSFIDPSGFAGVRFDGQDSAFIGGSMWRVDDAQRFVEYCQNPSDGSALQEACGPWAGILGEWLVQNGIEQSHYAMMDAQFQNAALNMLEAALFGMMARTSIPCKRGVQCRPVQRVGVVTPEEITLLPQEQSKLKNAAELLWPGFDLGTCMSSEGDCDGTDWILGVLGVIPGGKGGTLGIKGVLKGLKIGTSSSVKVVESSAELGKVFDELSVGAKRLEGTNYPGQLLEHADGTRVGLRSTSTSGGATIDVHFPDGSTSKVHIEGGGP